MEKLYPIGIQNFESLRKNGFYYVDKTDMVYSLASSGRYYFLSRPRRFGKSLLMSTFHAYFEGKKDLFEGLAIARLEKEWKEYPVLHFDLSGKDYSARGSLDDALGGQLSALENQYGVEVVSQAIDTRFKSVIDTVYRKTGQPVVILIDEYDKPIIDNFGFPELQESFRRQLQGFYSVLKSKDACIRFGFLTGVTKIGKLSIFSGLNNLDDISMDSAYSGICGISDAEIRDYFHDDVECLAQANGMSIGSCYQELKEMYDGYHFCENTDGIYNPFSLLNTLSKRKFNEYWFETGTPSFLVKVMKETSYDVSRLSDDEVGSSLLTDVDTALVNPVPLLYQSGYLTIKGYDPEYRLYTLGFPNREVKDGFLNFLLKYYAPVNSESTDALISRMTRDVRSGDAAGFMKRLEALFARTSYQIQGDCEKDFQYAMYIILELMGEYVDVERTTSNGRIDILIQTADYIYIIEIKTNESADAALAQIDDKDYARRFADDRRRIF